jgi:hypothetical protein
MLNSLGIQDSIFSRLYDVSAKINGRYRNANLDASEYPNIRFPGLVTKSLATYSCYPDAEIAYK